jgi:hypothetical protein
MAYIGLIVIVCILWYLIHETFETIKNIFRGGITDNQMAAIGGIIGLICYNFIF